MESIPYRHIILFSIVVLFPVLFVPVISFAAILFSCIAVGYRTSVKSTYSPSSFGIIFFFICLALCVCIVSSLVVLGRYVVRCFFVLLNPKLCSVSRTLRYILNKVAPISIAMIRANIRIIFIKVSMLFRYFCIIYYRCHRFS